MKKMLNKNRVKTSNNPKNNVSNRIRNARNPRRRRLINRRRRIQRRIINSNKRQDSIATTKVINNISKENTKINTKIDKLSDKLSKLTLEIFPKTTNIYRRLKEPRIDKMVSPMDMGLSCAFTSIFPTGNRIRYMSLYNRYEINTNSVANNQYNSFIWFPYAVNFQSYPDLAITVSDGTEDGTRQPDTICPLVRTVRLVNATTIQLSMSSTSACGLVGNYRVIGASMKITNTTAFTNKAGSYMVYKLNENTAFPPFYNAKLQPNATNSPDYTLILQNVVNANHDQVMLKQSFAASDKCLINEYNTYEGNNIFQTPNEYIGSSYISGAEPVAQWDGNPQGCNIKYQLDFPPTPSVNSYILETWQILEIVPDPGLNLDNITDFQTHVFNPDIVEQIRKSMPITKL